ncbi:MAG: oligosaccharide flippase family protein [Ignavibacteriae bacterium]|nr:oligosaccharide flippase family protein [Ignavibacteriota bacterium]
MKRPLRNLLSLAWSDLGSRAIGFFITVYLARVLGPAAYGLVGVGFAVLGHAQLLSSPGMQVVEARNAARPGMMDAVRFGGVVSVRVLLAVCVLVPAGVVTLLLPLDAQTTAVIVWSLVVLLPLAIAPDWFLQGRERMGPMGTARVFGYAVYGAVVWLLVGAPEDAAMAPVAYGAGILATATVLWLVVRKEFGLPHFRFDVPLWRSILRENFPVGIAMFVGQQVMNLPPILLAAMRTTTDAGVYTAALKLVFLLLALDRVLNALLLPALTRVRETRPADLLHVSGLVARSVVALAGLIVVPGMFIAPLMMQMVFGNAYADAGMIARILLVYVGLTLVNSVAVCLLLALGRERIYSRAMIIGSTVLAAAMVVFTPWWGPAGTALGAVLGELVTVFLMIRYASKEVQAFTREAFLRPLLAAGGAVIPGCALVGWSAPVAAGVAVTTFAAIAIGLKVFNGADLAYLKERFL